MGGTLYLKNGEKPNRKNVCISGYNRNKPNYCLSNFENNDGRGYDFLDPDVGSVHFPTAEHYLHFQKLTSDGKKTHLNAWRKESNPLQILKGIRDKKSPYWIQKDQEKYSDYTQWDEDKIFVQMQINASKHNQSDAFKSTIDTVIEVGRAFGDGGDPATVIEDTSSKHKPITLGPHDQTEEIWGTGPGGNGTNILGNSQTAFAMMLLDNKIALNRTPPLSDFSKDKVEPYYKKAEKQYQSGVKIVFKEVRERSGCNTGLGQPDTSDLGVQYAEGITAQKIVDAKQSSSTQNSNLPKPSEIEFMNRAQTKKLIIQNGQVIDRQYRKDTNSPWQKGNDPTRFKDLKMAYEKSITSSTSAPRVAVANANPVRTSNNHSYDHLWDAKKSDKDNVLAILTDYSKANAFSPGLALFFTGHWSRNHRGRVNTAIAQITAGTDVKEVIGHLRTDFNEITTRNTSGSLARRLAFIEDKLGIQNPAPSNPMSKR